MKKKAAKTTAPKAAKAVPAKIERAHVFYTGRVQGVGFRYTAEGHALEIGLYGWVKNLRDGRVELICEGSHAQIEDLFARIRDGMLGRHIQKTDVKWETATGEFTDFIVEFEH